MQFFIQFQQWKFQVFFVFVPKGFPTRVVFLVIKALLKYIHIALLSSFKWYYSIVFSTFWNHYHVLIPEFFFYHFIQKEIQYPWPSHSPFPQHYSLRQPLNYYFFSMDLNVRTFNIFGITQYVAFCVWCFSFSIFQSSSMLSHTSVLYVLSHFSCLWLFMTLCLVGSSVHGIL